MGLSGRKEQILQAVVDSYVESCEPVSSAEIKERHLPALSTATIRNELATLEEMGYLIQPHTSSGRIPTAEAYKLYVDRLMPKRRLTRGELKTVKRYFDRSITEIDDILKRTAKVLTEITNLTSVAYPENTSDAVVQSVKIVKLDDKTAVVIVVVSLGVLKDTTVGVSPDEDEDYFSTASKFVTDSFSGRTVSELVRPGAVVKQVKKEYEQLFRAVLKILKNYAGEESADDMVLEGSAKILEQPEYANLQKAKAMLRMLDAKEQLMPVLKINDDMDLNITIGKDNELKEGMPECAIVTASYSVAGVNIGKAGVIGPIRMDYPKVVSVLDYIGKTIRLLPGLGGESDDADPESGETE